MADKISEYIFNALGNVYCNTCRHFDSDNEDCEWCHRKSMMWSISEEAASSIAMKIVDLMQNGEQN